MDLSVFEHTVWESPKKREKVLSLMVLMEEQSQHESVPHKAQDISKEISCFEAFKSMNPADSPLHWWTRLTWLAPPKCNSIVLALGEINLAVHDIQHLIKINVLQLQFQITFANFQNKSVLPNIKHGLITFFFFSFVANKRCMSKYLLFNLMKEKSGNVCHRQAISFLSKCIHKIKCHQPQNWLWGSE